MVPAWIFGGFSLVLCVFQLALIGGAPWGHLTQGGRHGGALEPGARVLAAVSMVVVVLMAFGILSGAGSWPDWPRWTGWLALGIAGLAAVANQVSPSRPERRVWGPVSLVMLCCALLVMVGFP